MLSSYELQNRVFFLLPTYKEELRALEDRLIACGDVDHYFLEVVRSGMHVFGQAPKASPHYPANVPLDYIPCDHFIYIIRWEPIPTTSPTSLLELTKHPAVHGRESCSLCGKPLRLELWNPLNARDLVLVGCPSIREGQTVVDVLPIFSTTLVQGARGGALDIPYQRSKNPMTRVSEKL